MRGFSGPSLHPALAAQFDASPAQNCEPQDLTTLSSIVILDVPNPAQRKIRHTNCARHGQRKIRTTHEVEEEPPA
jgi:hypothetical protein